MIKKRPKTRGRVDRNKYTQIKYLTGKNIGWKKGKQKKTRMRKKRKKYIEKA